MGLCCSLRASLVASANSRAHGLSCSRRILVPPPGIELGLPTIGSKESYPCCIPWGRKESDMTEQLNTHNKFSIKSFILGLFMYLKNTIALLLFFLLYWAACGILVSLPCIELDPLTVRAPTVLPGNSHPLIV